MSTRTFKITNDFKGTDFIFVQTQGKPEKIAYGATESIDAEVGQSIRISVPVEEASLSASSNDPNDKPIIKVTGGE